MSSAEDVEAVQAELVLLAEHVCDRLNHGAEFATILIALYIASQAKMAPDKPGTVH